MFDGFFIVIIFIGIAIIAWFTVFRNWFSKKSSTTIESKQILNKVEKVFKLVLAEGIFNEIINSSSTDKKFFGLFSSTKKSLLIAEAKVLVGFDFKKVKLEIDQREKTIQFVNAPVPEVLSIETNFKFYDVTEGVFNKFKPEDYTSLLQAAKEHLKGKVENSELMIAAQEQLALLLEQITTENGYKLETYIHQKLIEKNNG